MRASALTRCIGALHNLFGGEQYVTSLNESERVEANKQTNATVEIIVCTTRACHTLADVPLPKDWYREASCHCEPMLLGFECHAMLRDRLGDYDYYCYLEDDLILHDPWLFTKLRYFTETSGVDLLLQPNRFEIAKEAQPKKVYIDGDLDDRHTAQFQHLGEHPNLEVTAFGQMLPCHRARNPHSGCFFLNAEQMEHWSRKPYFLDRDTRFVGPLESAATLGIMRTFRIYKPAPAVANFLEIEHFGDAWIRKTQHRNNVKTPHIVQRSIEPATLPKKTSSGHAAPMMQSLWIGQSLSTMERLSIASFLALGHPFHLYAYNDLTNVPPGTTLFDANTILPESEIFVYKDGVGKGSVAGFSDLFRFKLLLERGGWWVDLDVVALRPFEFAREYILGYQGTSEIGSAVICVPRGCELIQLCYEEAERIRANASWGEIGPDLLTKVAKNLELTWTAEPRIAFHPIDWRQAQRFIEPGGTLSRRSYAVHLIRHIWLWNKRDLDGSYHPTCIYEKLKRRYLADAPNHKHP